MIPQTHSPAASYLDVLNGPQREAVEALDGPVLVLAGAGTGKTRVLTTRLAHLLMTGRAMPGQILAVTFTNKAALEMRERVSHHLGGAPVEGWWLGTFHALCARMLRRHADLVGLSSQFTILDTDDQLRLMKQICELENIDIKKWPPKLIISMIDRWKDRGLKPGDLNAREGGDVAGGRTVQLYAMYQDRLRSVNACDFGDLLLHMITIFRDTSNGVLADYHRRFKYIMVDEYQDTNVSQYMWLRLLAQGAGNICCVGDDDQSIYGWRGAEIGNILKFEKDFPGAKIIRLEQNYRSTGLILAAAGGVIEKNQGRLGKTLWSEGEAGDKVVVRGLWDGEAEARWLGEEVEQLQNKKWRLRQMAVLVRASFQMRLLEDRFRKLGISHKVFGGPAFYERQEVRDALAYLRVVAQPADDLAFERIINVPKRGIGDATIQTLYLAAREQRISLYAATAQMAETNALKPKVKATLQNLVRDFERWRSLADTMSLGDLAEHIIDESGYLAMWKADKSPDSPGRIDNLKEFISSLEEFEGLHAFLEHVSLVMESQKVGVDDDYISIMTLHGAKGLEFDAVFLPGWEEGLFPSQRTMDENGMQGLEEERRLAYVGLTRARKRAYVSYVGNRQMYGSWVNAIPSRFVDELPPETVDAKSEGGLYNPGRSSHWDSSGFMSSGSSRASSSTSRAAAKVSAYKAGDEVYHGEYGRGRVVHIEGLKLDILFENGESHRLMESFVDPA